MLVTSCDGTLATLATPTTMQVVCNSTLSTTVKGPPLAVKVPQHSVRCSRSQTAPPPGGL
ncbi:DUF932 domain-containing protein [Pseudomonas sp. HR96]|uniref:DUF932 domain-containing protein n=1 Tax=Pseudomonas sp. HR96 TaxID=1027966 RepID=UPI0039BE291D